MNDICWTCDTKFRLKMCDGREGDFKYCFRKCGSIEGTKETITPFNTIEELYDIEIIKILDVKNLEIKDYCDNHFGLLVGEYKCGTIAPVGFIIK